MRPPTTGAFSSSRGSSRSSTRSSACGLGSTSSTGSPRSARSTARRAGACSRRSSRATSTPRPEGSVVFPGEAALTVEGPFWQAQLVGGLVQAAISDATVVATRFARLSLASAGADLVEDGASTAHRLGGTPLLARAAYVGGARATTSALAARRYGIPAAAVEPTRFALAVGDADRALRAWLAAAPAGGAVRIDPGRAGSTLPKLAAAVRDRKRASAAGWDEDRIAIELPAGDRAGLAKAATQAFAEVGLEPPAILVSGDVDERLVLSLHADCAPVRGFVVRAEGTPGTQHVAQYELVAIESGGSWSPRVRLGADAASSSEPGRKLLVRYVDADGHPVADVAHGNGERILRAQGGRYIDRTTGLAARLEATTGAPLRATVVRAGKRANPPEAPSAIRDRARASVQAVALQAPADRLARALSRRSHAAARRPEDGAARQGRRRRRLRLELTRPSAAGAPSPS